MTLLELLVKELPKRGGWPEWAVECFVHTNHEDIGYFYDEDGMDPGKLKFIQTHEVEHVETDTGSFAGNCITRDQYEAALAASQQPVWSGEGLPPVGVDVLAYIHKDNGSLLDWRRAKVVWDGYPGSAGEVLVFDIETTKPAWTDEFRPIRTEAERKRDSFINSINVNLDDMNEVLAERIYDAIAAGKIPGVKLTDGGE